jgi:hypothetical protein
MSTDVSIYDQATPEIKALVEKFKGDLNPTVGMAATTFLKSHFQRLNAERPNKLGGQRTNFYGQAAKGTFWELLPDGVQVNVNQVGIRQRWKGGPIDAGKGTSHITGMPTRFCTVPACAETYGKRASSFKLKFIPFKNHDGAMLIADEQRSRKATRTRGATQIWRGKVMYWLKEHIMQKRNSSVIPTDQEFTSYILKEVGRYLLVSKS